MRIGQVAELYSTVGREKDGGGESERSQGTRETCERVGRGHVQARPPSIVEKLRIPHSFHESRSKHFTRSVGVPGGSV